MVDPLSALAELTRFGRVLSGALSRETVASITRDCAQSLFAPAAFALAIVEPDGRVWLLASSGSPTPRADNPFLAELLVEDRVVRHRDPERLGTRLVAAGHTMGILALWSNRPGAFDDSDEAAVAAIGAQVAIALQNAGLFSILSSGKHEWEQLVDAIRPAIAVVDGAGAIRRANQAFAALVGSPVTALTGRPWLFLLPPAWAEPVGRALGAPDGEGGEIRTDNRTFTVRAHPLADEPGVSVLLIEDVTETRRLQEQLIQSEKLSAIGQLIAGVAHELNNPLSVVVARAVMLEEQGHPATKVAAGKIRTAAERCARIVRTFLAMARQQPPERGPVAVNEVVSAALDMTAYAVRTSNIEVAVDLADDIPTVLADPDQLHQVLLNLIVNAQQVLQDRPGKRRIRVASRFDPDALVIRIAVADNGPGIPEHLRARVFEPYFTTKPSGLGTGVGLAVSHGIVTAHGGTLTLDCPEMGGAVLTITLPVCLADESDDADGPSREIRASRRKILIVDDEAEIRDILAEILREGQHRVAAVSSGREALERMASERYDVILTDIRMPDLDGRTLYREIERRWPEQAARVVFVTGDSLAATLHEFASEHGRPVIEKPFVPRDVRRIVAEIASQDA
jgi:two-component system NtrC family sensor kinase